MVGTGTLGVGRDGGGVLGEDTGLMGRGVMVGRASSLMLIDIFWFCVSLSLPLRWL